LGGNEGFILPITRVSSSLSPAGLGHNRAERDECPSHRSGKIADYARPSSPARNADMCATVCSMQFE
jgi:hypothetical protein